MASTEDFGYVYSEKLLEAIPQDLICSICVKVLTEPHLVNCCEQQFCKSCLEKSLESSKACPYCHSRTFSYMLMSQKSSEMADMKLQVCCPNKAHGCKCVLKISDYDAHLSSTNNGGCLYAKLNCPNGCNALVFRGDMADHRQRICPNRSPAQNGIC